LRGLTSPSAMSMRYLNTSTRFEILATAIFFPQSKSCRPASENPVFRGSQLEVSSSAFFAIPLTSLSIITYLQYLFEVRCHMVFR
jgi:hypothetical protein